MDFPYSIGIHNIGRNGAVIVEDIGINISKKPTATSSHFILPMTQSVVIVILCTIMIVITVAGNSIVIVAFALDRHLRQFSNFLILNLAVTDLVVGLFCIPPYVPYLLTGHWPFGRGFCIFWLVSDYVTPLASSWSVLMISLDRYLSVRFALTYKAKQTRNLMTVFMLIPWVVGILVYGPAIIFWEHWTGSRSAQSGECFVEFKTHLPYLLFGSAVEFIFPFITTTAVNLLIYENIRKRTRMKESMTQQHRATIATFSNNNQHTHIVLPPVTSSHDKYSSKRLHRDKKTAKAIAIIIVVFGICWGPFEVLSLISSLCANTINPVVFEVSFWLLWINSTLNPLLYPFTHRQFRLAFYKLFFKKCDKFRRVEPVHSMSLTEDHSRYSRMTYSYM
ncbi:histamine H3 receptor-like [Lineus longissimus]|uniref:histamine H3 receptor-like n=1 Tax=Lineus longissimus TaxID=88925 RepID=UPI00315C6440